MAIETHFRAGVHAPVPLNRFAVSGQSIRLSPGYEQRGDQVKPVPGTIAPVPNQFGMGLAQDVSGLRSLISTLLCPVDTSNCAVKRSQVDAKLDCDMQDLKPSTVSYRLMLMARVLPQNNGLANLRGLGPSLSGFDTVKVGSGPAYVYESEKGFGTGMAQKIFGQTACARSAPGSASWLSP